MQALQGMRGEPETHLETYSQSCCVASSVNIDSSCGSEYSTPPHSPNDQQYQSFASEQCSQHHRATVAYLHSDKVDTDTGLTTLCLVLML